MTRTATWNRIGTAISKAQNVEEALNIANLNYEVEKVPVFLENGFQVPGAFATKKVGMEDTFGVVGEKYEVVQNLEAFNFVDTLIPEGMKFIKAGETTKMIYIIASLPDTYILDDKVTPYLIFQNSHCGKSTLRATITPLRIICQNQFNWAFRKASNKITIRHTRSAKERLEAAKSILLHVGEEVDTEQCVNELGLPVFVKPNAGGSSYATTKVKTPEELQPAIAAAKREATGEVIIESFMQGTEVTCGCYTSRDGLRALPITEVVSKKEFFDVDAKYNGAVEEITPARISDEMTQKIQALTRRIYGYVGAKGIIRVDYIIIGDTPHLLEVNTTPGMTATSFIPQEVRAAGLDISDVMDDVITFGSL